MFVSKFQIHQISGRLVADPEFQETKNGKLLLSFALAYDTYATSDAQGSHANFIQVSAWEKLASAFHGLLKKGMSVIVNGELVQNRWTDKDGKKRSNFVLIASSIYVTKAGKKTQEEMVA